MGSEWKTAKLTDHYEIRSGLSKPAKDFGSGYPFLTFKDVFYNYFTPEKLGDLVESTEKDRLGCSVLRGDVFLTRTSETMNELGMSCVAIKDYENSTFNGFCKRLRPKADSELVPEYVGYYLRSPLFRRSMIAFSTMSTRASLNNEMISRLDISYPDPGEQVEIARVLKTLDEKISLNNQINQTLEQMAQTLFKSWFVDFDPVIDNALDAGSDIPEVFETRVERRKAVRESADFKPLPDDVRQLFPSEFEESELGWVPKGWIVQYSGGIFDVRDGTHDSPKKSDDGFPLVTSRHLTSGNLDLSSAYLISEDDYDKVNKRSKVDHGDILLTMIGTVGVSYLVNVAKVNFAIKNVGLFKTSATPELRHYFYQMLRSKETTSFLESRVAGTTQKYLSLKVLRNIPILLPCYTLLKIFNYQVEPYSRQHQFNLDNTSSLSKLRDTLLPKLISGELRLDSPEVEQAKALVE